MEPVSGDFRAWNGSTAKFRYCVEALSDLGFFDGRDQQAAAEETASHACAGVVQHVDAETRNECENAFVTARSSWSWSAFPSSA